jgi:hypothetical protein
MPTLAVICLSGCGNAGTEPDYESNSGKRKMHVGAWVAPPPSVGGSPDFLTYEKFKEVADSGVTVIYDLYNGDNVANTVKALNLCEEAGIQYYARDFRISELLDQDIDNIDPALIAKFDVYRNKPALAGHLVADEPGSKDFERLGKLRPLYEKVFPGKDFYINVFPSYANTADTQEGSYYDYVDKYIETVRPKMLSYDAYPLLGSIASGKTSVHESLLMNLEIAAGKAQKAGIPFWKFVQSMGFGLENRELKGVRDMAFQFYVDMAYGSRGIQHFCYWTPLGSDRGTEFLPAMIDAEGNKTDNYAYAQAMNLEIQKFEHVYLSFDWTGTMLQLGKRGEKNLSFNMVNNNTDLKTNLGKVYPYTSDGVKSIESGEDCLLGVFEDTEGNPAYMLVNYSDPGLNLKNNVTVSFKGVSKAVVYVKGEKTVAELKGGKYTVELESGQGVFIIPFQ